MDTELKPKSMLERLKDWTTRNAENKHAQFWLFLISFAEASFFPIPPDIVLLGMMASGARRWIRHFLIATVGSILGGIAGYYIGFGFFELIGQPIIDFYHLQTQFVQIGEIFSDYSFWTIFAAAFTPIPFKVFTIAGGFFKINFWIFLIASTIGRALRFFIVALVSKLYGPKLADVFYKYFNVVLIIIVLLILIALIYLSF